MNFIRAAYLKFRQSLSRDWPSFYRLCEKRKAIIKFILVGSLSGGLDLVLLYVFYSLWGWGIVWSTSVAFIFALLVSFTLQKLWTFRDYDHNRLAGQISLYSVNAFIGININGFLMHLLVNKYGLWYLLAQIMVNVFIAVQNFLVYKFIVFKAKHKNFEHHDVAVLGTTSLGSAADQSILSQSVKAVSLESKQDWHEIKSQ